MVAIVAAAHELASHPPDQPAVLWVVGSLAVALALALGTWGLVSTATTRVMLGHWREPTLRPLLRRELWYIALLLITGAAGLLLLPSPVAGLAVGVVLIFVCWFGHPLSKQIATAIDAIEGVETVSEYYGRRRLYGLLSGSDETTQEAGAGEDAGPLQRFFAWWFVRLPGQLVSRFRLAAAGALLAVGLLAVVAGAGTLLSRRIASTRSGGEQTLPAPPPQRSRSRHVRGTPPAPARATASLLSPRETTWLRRCGPDAEPGRDAPEEWARLTLYALYLGGPWLPPRVEPPGAVAGCTGHVFASSRAPGFFYTFGTIRQTGEVRSIAVATRRFRSAIFIAPAVTPVIALIQRYGEIGAYARLDVGPRDRGDCYAVQTSDGIEMLVRAAKTTGNGLAGRYVELPPPVAAAWWDAMADHGRRWLWPLAGVDAAGRPAFRLVSDPYSGPVAETIAYDAAVGIATRTLPGGVRSYGPTGLQFAEQDLIARAATAR